MRGAALLAASALALGLTLAACGGEESGAGGTSASHSDSAAIAPLRVPGGGSGQFTVEGGDNSVQEYGSEAGEPELREAAETVHTFLSARVAGEWARACAILSQGQLETLEGVAVQSSGPQGKGCPETLVALTKPASAPLQRAITTVEAASLRTDGDRAFLIYVGPPERTVYAMPLVRESNTWKLGAISSSVLPGT